MTHLTIRLTCDRATAPTYGLIFGADWARVELTSPPRAARADWVAYIGTVLSVLAHLLSASTIDVSRASPVFVADGPELPAAGCDVLSLLRQTWLVVAPQAAPRAAPTTPTPETKSVESGPSLFTSQPSDVRPTTARPTESVPATGAGAQSRMSPEAQKAALLELASAARAAAARNGQTPQTSKTESEIAKQIVTHVRSELAKAPTAGATNSSEDR